MLDALLQYNNYYNQMSLIGLPLINFRLSWVSMEQNNINRLAYDYVF